ncbi:MAG: hypothetical protein IIY55_06650 [Blautia sp.]|nr:hypothetical protein [Blautia sp.]
MDMGDQMDMEEQMDLEDQMDSEEPLELENQVGEEDWQDIQAQMSTGAQKNPEDPAGAEERMHEKGRVISPIYVGDYLCYGKSPSACVKYGDYLFAIDGIGTKYGLSIKSNKGQIRIFDLKNNVELREEAITADVGHANSVAFDGNYFYVSPLYDHTGDKLAMANYMYRFDNHFRPIGIEKTPFAPLGVSFDHVTQRLYIYRGSRIYVRTEKGEWKPFTKVDFTGTGESDIWRTRWYNQDFAVYNNHFYISSPMGTILCGTLVPGGVSRITGSFYLYATDSFHRFYMGELEGMEFDRKGRLYALDRVGLTGNLKDVFIVELPVGEAVPHNSNLGGALFHLHDGILSLSEKTQKKFALNTNEIRSLSQLEGRMLQNNSSIVSIDKGQHIVENYRVRTNTSFSLFLGGTYECKGLDIFNGHLDLYGFTQENRLILTTDDRAPMMTVKRSGTVSFSGGYPINVSAPNTTSKQLVDIGATSPFISVRKVPVRVEGGDLTIGASTIRTNGYFIGGYAVHTQVHNLTREYIENEYVPKDSVRIRGRKTDGGVVHVVLMFEVTKNLPEDGTPVTIGKLNGMNAYGSKPPYHETVAVSRDGKGVVDVSIVLAGEIRLRAFAPSIGVYRVTMSVVLG